MPAYRACPFLRDNASEAETGTIMDKQVQNDEAETARGVSVQAGSQAEENAATASETRPRRRRLASGLRLLFLGVVLAVALVRHFQDAG